MADMEDALQELMQREAEEEIKKTAVMEGQIIALILLMKELGIIDTDQIRWWEKKSEEVTGLLEEINTAAQLENDTPEAELRAELQAGEAALQLTVMLAGDDEALEPITEKLNQMRQQLERINESKNQDGD